MPSKEAIYEYWMDGPGWEEWENQGICHLPGAFDCFACGDCLLIERAHIVPIWKGGSDDCSNLHLLCRSCHTESEHLTAHRAYWNWLRSKNEDDWQPAGMHGLRRLQRSNPEATLERMLRIYEKGVPIKDLLAMMWAEVEDSPKYEQPNNLFPENR